MPGIQYGTPQVFDGDLGYDAWALFGDGSDTAVNLTSGTTTLARDMFYTTLSVSGTAILVTAGYRIFASVSVTVQSGGRISWNGNAGGGAGTGGALLTAAVLGGAPAGGQSASNNNGQAGGSQTNSFGGSGGAGGGCPANGTTGGAGGTGGRAANGLYTANAPAATAGWPRTLPQVVLGHTIGNGGVIRFAGGAGGGSGGGDITGGGACGGSGGGVVVVCAPLIDVQVGGILSANGGAGGTRGIALNEGGGGGGGGGVLLLTGYRIIQAGTVTANGGAHGHGEGTGLEGADGAAGTVFVLPLAKAA